MLIRCKLNLLRNIGRFATIRENLSVGRHILTCELLEKTSDPGGGTEFRLIGVMRSVKHSMSGGFMDKADYV